MSLAQLAAKPWLRCRESLRDRWRDWRRSRRRMRESGLSRSSRASRLHPQASGRRVLLARVL